MSFVTTVILSIMSDLSINKGCTDENLSEAKHCSGWHLKHYTVHNKTVLNDKGRSNPVIDGIGQHRIRSF